MENQKVRQLVKDLNKKLDNWDWQKAIDISDNETATRNVLIHPFLKLLNYDEVDDFFHEVTADLKNKKGKKIDVAITLGGKNPLILVECKKATAKLNDNHFIQLRNYCTDTNSAKLGILTNGIIYKFYSRDSDNVLQSVPFFEFDLSDYSNQDLEMLAMFMRNVIDINSILEEAEEIYFLEKFDDALYEALVNPSKEFIKVVYKNMGGKKMTDKVSSKIKALINGTSLNGAANKIIKHEAATSNSGIITTDEEIKAYNVIKTIMAMSSKFKNADLDRISYRDLKGKFTGGSSMPSLDFEMKEYGKYIDLGVRGKKSNYTTNALSPFKFGRYGDKKAVPVAPIKAWCRQKGLPVKAAYAIAKSVYQKGIKRSMFFSKPFEKRYKPTMRLYHAAIADDMATNIANQLEKKLRQNKLKKK